VEQCEAGYHRICGAVFNLPTSESRALEASRDAQAVVNTEVEVG
jgi:hypothetical protein